jgi:hypothetical protein
VHRYVFFNRRSCQEKDMSRIGHILGK